MILKSLGENLMNSSTKTTLDKNANIVIVGLGVIGGSFAMGLKELGYYNVYGIDTDIDTLKKAKAQDLIRNGSQNGQVSLKDADLMILAIYPRLVLSFMREHIDQLKDGAIVTDVTGVKIPIIQDIEEIIGDKVDFVFGHPMAGREKKGFDFANNGVFKGANYIITPIPKNKEVNIQKIENLAYDLGFKRVKRITPQLHDEMIGYTSQLTHAIAVALINSDKEERDTCSFIGDSYRDLTRIAKINEKLWSELFLENKNNLLQSIYLFEKELDKIKNKILEDDVIGLESLFISSTKRRESIDLKDMKDKIVK